LPLQASAERMSDAVKSAGLSGGRLDMGPVTSPPFVENYPRTIALRAAVTQLVDRFRLLSSNELRAILAHSLRNTS
jgi:hypothetical protein